MDVLCSCHFQLIELSHDAGRRPWGKRGMQPVHWVHVYVKVNLIMLIKKGYSGLNKPVNRGEPVSVRVAGSEAMSSVSTTPLKREPELHLNSNQNMMRRCENRVGGTESSPVNNYCTLPDLLNVHN